MWIGTVRLRQGGPITSLAYSPDGKRLTSTDWHTVAAWDTCTGRSLAFRFLPPQVGCWPVVSPDGALIACRLESGHLGVQEAESGNERCRLPSKKDRILNLAFSRDNRWLVANDDDGNAYLWDVPAKKLFRHWKLPVPGKPLDSRYTFTPDGKTLIQAQRGHIFLWDVPSGKQTFHIETNEEVLWDVAVSPNGELLATRNNAGRIDLWHVKTGRFSHEIAAQPCDCGPVFTGDGKQILCGTDRGEICCWDVEKAKLVRRLKGSAEGYPASLAISPDGKHLASGGHDHAVHLWDLASDEERFPPGKLGGKVTASLLADGKTLVSHCEFSGYLSWGRIDPRLGFWDLAGKTRKLTAFETKDAHAFVLAPDADTTVFAHGPHFGLYFRPTPNKYLRSSLRLCDLATGKELVEVNGLPCQILDLAYSPNGRYLFATAFNAGPNDEDYHTSEVVQVWKKTGRTGLEKVADLPSADFSFVCAPNSQWVGAWSKPGWKFHHCETGKLLRNCPDIPGVVRAASPSGRVLACASDEDRTACVVELATGKTLCKLECRPRYLVRPRFAFSPDGKIVASDLNSAEITLWDAFTGKQMARLQGHRGDICSLCFSPDGRYLITGSADTTILIWDYRRMLSRAPGEAARLTPERLEQLWVDLQSADAERGYRAVAALLGVPEQATELLRKKIPLTAAHDQRRIQAIIADLDSASFEDRTRADAELSDLGPLAESALRLALSKPLGLEKKRRIERILDRVPNTPPPGRWLGVVRALDALELIGSREAQQLLEEWSKGGAEAPQAQEARRSLERLKRRLASETTRK